MQPLPGKLFVAQYLQQWPERVSGVFEEYRVQFLLPLRHQTQPMAQYLHPVMSILAPAFYFQEVSIFQNLGLARLNPGLLAR